MALLSFFGSAQAILKILQCKTFSITTAEMSRLTMTGITKLPDNLSVGGKIYGFNPPAPVVPGGKRPDAAPDRRPQP